MKHPRPLLIKPGVYAKTWLVAQTGTATACFWSPLAILCCSWGPLYIPWCLLISPKFVEAAVVVLVCMLLFFAVPSLVRYHDMTYSKTNSLPSKKNINKCSNTQKVAQNGFAGDRKIPG